MEVKNLKKHIFTILLSALVLCVLAVPARALDDDEFSGYSADTLTIDVGYFGGPYYEKHVFTLDELGKMDIVTNDYTFIDNMPAVVIDHVKGVRLSDLMEAAGIDLGSVGTFYFWTLDKTSSYYTSFSKTVLIDTPRYCYYSLPDNFDANTGAGNEYATSDARRVDTVIALADDWNRCIAGATFGSDYENLNTNTRFRLIYGQTDAATRTADRSAKWIHKIVVELGGAPTITLDKTSLDMKVGSVKRAEARVHAADSAIEQQARVTWSSSDESTASVDENGNITVHRAGTAVITASLNGKTASLKVNGSAAPTDGGGASAGGDGTDKSGAAGSAGTTGQKSSTGSNTSENQSGSSVEVTVGKTTQTKNDAAASQAGTAQNNSGINSILPGSKGTQNDKGGVQNWRVYEMAQDAVELPVINENDPLLPVIGMIAASLFGGGIIYRILKYRYDLEDKPHVFSHKSQ